MRVIFQVEVIHVYSATINTDRSYTNSKYFSIAIHHKIIVRIAIAGELVKMKYIVQRRIIVWSDPVVKPFFSFADGIIVI